MDRHRIGRSAARPALDRKEGHHDDRPDRRELIAALHELVTFAEGLLEVNGRLLEALADERPPSPEALADARRHHERRVGQLAGFRKRLAGLMIVPPERVQ
jgi:hypothetical protein